MINQIQIIGLQIVWCVSIKSKKSVCQKYMNAGTLEISTSLDHRMLGDASDQKMHSFFISMFTIFAEDGPDTAMTLGQKETQRKSELWDQQ